MNEDSMTNDDIALSAYLDGELPQDQADRLSERLAREPLLAGRLEAMRASDDATRKLYAKLDDLPMPQSVLDMLAAPAAAPSNVVSFPMRVARQFWQAPVAIAASVALLAGFLVHDLLLEPSSRVDAIVAGEVANGTELHELLESGLSGSSQNLQASVRGELLLTFQDTAGDFCRQFRLDSASRAMQAVACRRSDGWYLEAADFDAVSANGQYQQASGGSAVNAVVDGLIGGNEPLGAVEESRLVREGWKNTDD